MFKILDGRDKFYQWDKNRKLIVEDSSINQVHFCNRYGNCSLIRATYQLEGKTLVDVPNVILQDSFKLHVYAYDTEYTKHEDVFEIVARTKPEDYINTEEDVKLWDELAQKLIDLESKIDGEGIQAAVIKYLTDNPPEAGATQEEAAQIEQNRADIEELRGEVAAIEIPDVSNFATTGYVDEAIADIDFPEGADLTGYATKSYVDSAVENIEHPQPDLSDYAKKTDIPSTSGFATTTYVDNAVANVSVDLTDYYTKEEVDIAIDAELDKSFFLDFTNATTTIKQITSEVEMKLFCEELEKGNSVCANIREASNIAPLESNFYYPAIIQKVDNTTFNLMRASINLNGINDETKYGVYQFIKEGSVWAYRRILSDTYHIVTTENLDTTLADYAKTADIPSGGSGGAAEVAIGTTAPVNGEVLWINPEGDNNYLTKDNLVNGGSMMENADGTLSTVIGGSRTLKMAGGAVVQTKDGVAAWTNANPNRSIFQFGLYDKTEKTALYSSAGLTDMSFSNTTNYSIEYNVHHGGLITPHKYNLKYASSTQLLFIEDNELFTSLEWHSSWSDLVFSIKIDTANFYNNYKIGEIKLYIGDVYEKSLVDGTYIPIGRGLTIYNGSIASSLPLDNSHYENDVVAQRTGTIDFSKGANRGCAVFGKDNNVTAGQGVIVLGRSNQVTGGYAVTVTIGDNNVSSYINTATLIGKSNVSQSGSNTYLFGEGLQAGNNLVETAIGHYNNYDSSTHYPIMIGNGTSSSSRLNAMTIDTANNASFGGTVTSQGADYAEYFEWADGNPEAEDRVGYIVALAGDKIHKAQAGEEVLGIISGTVAVLGDNYEWHWNGKYLTDDFGRVIYDLVDKYSEPTEDEPEPKFLGQVKVPRINPEWDETKEYKNRANRAEWDTVGMFGKLFVRDDGSCVVGGYATTGADGLATLATGKTNMYVMDRINDNIVKVLLK